jgi:hypothetical protein
MHLHRDSQTSRCGTPERRVAAGEAAALHVLQQALCSEDAAEVACALFFLQARAHFCRKNLPGHQAAAAARP